MARRMLMSDVSEGRLNRRREGGLGRQRYDGGGCVTMHERYERLESPGAYVDD